MKFTKTHLPIASAFALALLASASGLAGLIAVSDTAEAHAGSFSAIKISATTATVRTGPSTSYASLGTADLNDKYVKTGTSGTYTKIWFKGTTGYVLTSSTAAITTGLVTKITGTTVNVRSGPGTTYSDIGDVHNGEAYIVLDSSDARSGGHNNIEYIWHQIQYTGSTGWVYDQYTNEGSVGGQIETNFSEAELHSTRTACTVFHISKDLTTRLQNLRNNVGSITLSNGYRCPSHNTAVGGSATSYHISGQAADITNCGGLAYNTCVTRANNVGLDALNEGDHVHVSVPQGGGV